MKFSFTFRGFNLLAMSVRDVDVPLELFFLEIGNCSINVCRTLGKARFCIADSLDEVVLVCYSFFSNMILPIFSIRIMKMRERLDIPDFSVIILLGILPSPGATVIIGMSFSGPEDISGYLFERQRDLL